MIEWEKGILFTIAVIIGVALVFVMALLQGSLVFGAPFGEYVLGGQHRVLPKKMRLVSGGISLAFIVVGISYLQVAGAIGGFFNPVFVKVLLAAFTVFIACAIVSNGFITKSKKEKYIMTPCTIVQFICSVYILICSY